MKRIIVSIEGGMLHTITDIPDGVEVEVRDYDIDGAEVTLETNECGEQYIQSIWP